MTTHLICDIILSKVCNYAKLEVMMKKILALILAGLMTVSFVACGDKNDEENKNDEAVNAEQNYVEEKNKNGKFEFALNEEGDYEIVKYIPYSTKAHDITLPKEINKRSIVGIAADAFKAENTIVNVTIPSTYTYISNYAFYDCDSLKSVSLPKTLETIGEGAFQNCDNLKSVKIPAAVKEISAFTFKDCKSITSMDLSSVEKIQKGAFMNCTSLESVTVSSKITYATKEAFYGCESLVYNEQDGLYYLGDSSNKTIVLVSPKSLTLDECTVSSTTKIVADGAFANCDQLFKITLSDSIKAIYGSTFTGCTELSYNKSENGLYLGSALNPYMVLVKLDVSSVEDFKLSKSTKLIIDTAFDECSALEDISFEGSSTQWNAIIKDADWNNDLKLNVTCSDKIITVLAN